MYAINNMEGFNLAIKKSGYRFLGIKDITDTLGDMYISKLGNGPVAIISRGGADDKQILVQLMMDPEDKSSNTALFDALNEYGFKFDISI